MRTMIKKSTFIFALAALTLFLALVQAARSFGQFKRSGALGQGIELCFYRTGQSYTALLWNAKNSPYRAESFFKTTEECFGDLIDEARSLSLQAERAEFNEFASLAHWFHLGILDVNTPMQAVQNKYEALESKKDSLVAIIEKQAAKDSQAVMTGLYLLAGLILTWMSCLGWRFYQQHRDDEEKKSALDYFAEQARAELDSRDFPLSSRIENIILQAFDFHKMSECKELFFNYHTKILEGKVGNAVVGNITQVNKVEAKEIDEAELPPFSLNKNFEEVVDSFQGQLLAEKIFYMDDFAAELTLYGSEKGFRELVKMVFIEGLRTLNKEDEKKLINITTKKLGGLITIDLEFLAEQKPANISRVQKN